MMTKTKTLLSLFLLAVSTAGFGQTDKSIVKFSNPPSLHSTKGYSHIASVDLGTCTMIILSGQVPLDAQGNLAGKGDISKQAEQVFVNIKNAITDAGGSMDNIVKLSYYLLEGTEIQPVRDVRVKFLNPEKLPASTLVKVSGLFRDDILLEVEATAIIPKK